MLTDQEIKEQFVEETRKEFGLLESAEAAELYLLGTLTLRQLLMALRSEFNKNDYVFFRASEAIIRQRLSEKIVSFLNGHISHEDLLKELKFFT